MECDLVSSATVLSGRLKSRRIIRSLGSHFKSDCRIAANSVQEIRLIRQQQLLSFRSVSYVMHSPKIAATSHPPLTSLAPHPLHQHTIPNHSSSCLHVDPHHPHTRLSNQPALKSKGNYALSLFSASLTSHSLLVSSRSHSPNHDESQVQKPAIVTIK